VDTEFKTAVPLTINLAGMGDAELMDSVISKEYSIPKWSVLLETNFIDHLKHTNSFCI